MASFKDLKIPDGLKELNDHLLTRSYIEGYQASRDDLAVYSALSGAPEQRYQHALRWYKHIEALLGASFPGKGAGVSLAGGSAPTAAPSASPASAAQTGSQPPQPQVPPTGQSFIAEVLSNPAAAAAAAGVGQSAPKAAPAPAAAEDDDDDSDDDDDDFFGEQTEEEKAAAAEKARIIEAAKKRGTEKAKLTKSLVILDVKPWDDTTDLAKLEAEVRSVQKDGLLWGSSKLVPVGFGIRKLQITCVIEDAKVESMDIIIEDDLVKDGESELIQSVDVVAFNKL